jgi:hypothetical protein
MEILQLECGKRALREKVGGKWNIYEYEGDSKLSNNF